MSGHPVELIAERLQLVAGLDREPQAEVAAADPPRALRQDLDRHGHAPAQKERDQHRTCQQDDQEKSRAPDRRIDRRIGLGERQLDEHQPAQRGDRRIGRQHALTGQILLDQAAGGRPDAIERGPDVGMAGEIAAAQRPPQIGMRDQDTHAIDHIGLPGVADPDSGDEVPDEAKIDLGDNHIRRQARSARGECHERLGVAEEVDRPVICAAFVGAAEGLRGGEVGLAADPVRDTARHAHLLAALGVELGDVRNRRREAQEADGVQALVLVRGQLRGQAREPSDLVFDLANELADLDGGACCLLALGRRQELLLLAIGEPDVEAGVDGERGESERDDRVEVFAEQPAGRWPQISLVDRLVHSRISSARASSVNGIVKSSVRATVRLIRSSYFRGDCTGRSPALVPRRMRST